MTDLALPSSTASLRTMAGIEARRLARHPAFIIGNVLAFGVLVLLFVLDDKPDLTDLLSMPIIPAFFIGVTSMVATARLTRSTEVTAEALGTAPGSEADRTKALVVACLVPFAAGLAWTGVQLGMAASRGVHPNEWWFGTLPDWQVWSILLSLGPVACLGGGLLGVLTGRWVRFPGAAAVAPVAVVAITMVGQMSTINESTGRLRLWVVWAGFHSGGDPETGTADLWPGNPGFYLLYLLCLCAAAALVAVWHDRAARTSRVRVAIIGVTVVGLACLALAMTTGSPDNQRSEPIPYRIDK